MDILFYLLLGLTVGAFSGLLGLGGGLLLIPALVILFGFAQKEAQGTSLAMMLPPVGLFAVMQYYKNGYVNVRAAIPLAIAFAVGAWFVSGYVPRIPQETLRRIFAVFLFFTAGYFLFSGTGLKMFWVAGGGAAFLLGGVLRRKQPPPSDDFPQI